MATKTKSGKSTKPQLKTEADKAEEAQEAKNLAAPEAHEDPTPAAYEINGTTGEARPITDEEVAAAKEALEGSHEAHEDHHEAHEGSMAQEATKARRAASKGQEARRKTRPTKATPEDRGGQKEEGDEDTTGDTVVATGPVVEEAKEEAKEEAHEDHHEAHEAKEDPEEEDGEEEAHEANGEDPWIKSAYTTKARTFPLKDINRKPASLMRVGADKVAIADWANHLRDLPPIKVARGPNKEIWCVDGIHRIEAHELAGEEGIRAYVIDVANYAEAFGMACHSNTDNLAVRLTSKDKRQRVVNVLKDEIISTWSKNRIAEVCMCDPKTVKTIMDETGWTPKGGVLVGKDGREQPATRYKPTKGGPKKGSNGTTTGPATVPMTPPSPGTLGPDTPTTPDPEAGDRNPWANPADVEDEGEELTNVVITPVIEWADMTEEERGRKVAKMWNTDVDLITKIYHSWPKEARGQFCEWLADLAATWAKEVEEEAKP